MTRDWFKKYQKEIMAWSKGETIQAECRDGGWMDVSELRNINSMDAIRIKPKTYDCGVLGELTGEELKGLNDVLFASGWSIGIAGLHEKINKLLAS